jgi:hypothetical protein
MLVGRPYSLPLSPKSRKVPADERVLTDPRAGAKLLARVVQGEGAEHEDLRLCALELLRQHAGQREVIAACCIGCGASRGLKTCERCHVARFCGAECMRQMWPTHKRCCKEWAAQAAMAGLPLPRRTLRLLPLTGGIACAVLCCALLIAVLGSRMSSWSVTRRAPD